MCSCYHFRHELLAWSPRPGVSCSSRGVWGTFTGSSTRGDLHTNTHTSTRTHLSEEIIIHYPFKEKNIFISLQWHLLCKMSLQQCTQAAHRNWVLCCGTWPGVHGKMCSALSPSFVRDAAVTARGMRRDNNKIYK